MAACAFATEDAASSEAHGSLRGLIPGRVSINERPQIVDERRRFGDWEGDTLYGSRARNCLLTQVERKSRYLIVGKLSDRRAINVAKCHSEQFQCVPNTWRKTLPLDNGKEFAAFQLIEQASDLRVFFAELRLAARYQ
ncbi:MAG: IS30 family transposase [Burkholderiales bacterium]